jgi:hypothetical protein
MISKTSFLCSVLASCVLLYPSVLSSGEIYNTPKAPIKFSTKDIKDYGLAFEHVKIEIKGLKRNYNFLWLSDLHVISEDLSEIELPKRKMIAYRRDKRFANAKSGKNPVTLWRALPKMLNNSGANMIFLGGDICDYGSIENMKILKEGNFITIDDKGYIEFTDEGYKLAQEVYNRHQALTQFLVLIGVDKEQAENDACRIEHVISKETYYCIANFVKKQS